MTKNNNTAKFQIFIVIALLLCLSNTKAAERGPRNTKDLCVTLISKLPTHFEAKCQSQRAGDDESEEFSGTVIPDFTGKTLSFLIQSPMGFRNLSKISIEPTPAEDVLIRNFTASCKKDSIEVSYLAASGQQKVTESLVNRSDKTWVLTYTVENSPSAQFLSCVLN